MRSRIALWSADYARITGQALVTARVVHHQPAVIWQEYVYRGGGLRSVITWAGAACRLWRDIAFGRVEAIYLVCSRSNGGLLRDIPALLAAHFGVRTVVHAHGSDIVELLSVRWLSPLARTLYTRCGIIVPSTHLLDPLRKLTRAPIHLCENYLSGDLGERTGEPHPPLDTLSILWNSNIMASKGFFDLAEAVRRMRHDGLMARLVSVGQPIGDEEMSISEAGRRLHALMACEWFDYHGKVDPEEVMALIEEADVICLPSRYSSECQPLAIIQAMCAGKAIVVSETPALRATLGEYPAFWVPVRSSAAIADALQDLCRQKQSDVATFSSSRRPAAAAAQKRFSVDRFDREMAAILRPAQRPL